MASIERIRLCYKVHLNGRASRGDVVAPGVAASGTGEEDRGQAETAWGFDRRIPHTKQILIQLFHTDDNIAMSLI